MSLKPFSCDFSSSVLSCPIPLHLHCFYCVFNVIKSPVVICFLMPFNHTHHCWKFISKCHLNSFLSIDFHMTFIPLASLEAAVVWLCSDKLRGWSKRRLNYLPLRQWVHHCICFIMKVKDCWPIHLWGKKITTFCHFRNSNSHCSAIPGAFI